MNTGANTLDGLVAQSKDRIVEVLEKTIFKLIDHSLTREKRKKKNQRS